MYFGFFGLRVGAEEEPVGHPLDADVVRHSGFKLVLDGPCGELILAEPYLEPHLGIFQDGPLGHAI